MKVLSGVLATALVTSCAGNDTSVGSSEEDLSSTTFEVDGDLAVNHGGVDWATAPDLKPAYDLASGSTDDALGQGAKEDDIGPSIVDGSIPNNKSDLSRFYVSHEHRACPQNTNGCDFLYLAWERNNTLGSANFDFEFDQSTTKSSNGVTPIRTAGDIVITYDFAQGGSAPAIGIARWITSGTCQANGSKPPCWGPAQTLADPDAQGAINDGFSVSDPIQPNAPRTLATEEFGEAAINLTTTNVLSSTSCTSFGRAWVRSRSSASFSSEIKDFIAPIAVDINNCQPWTINLKKVDPQGNYLAGATMALYLDNPSGGTAGVLDATDTQVGSNCTTSSTDGIGTCSFTNLTTAGTYIGHEVTAPNGYSKAADQTQVVTIDQASHTVTLTFTDTPVPGEVDITKTDDAGNPVSGILFTLSQNNTVVKSCTTGTDGKCKMTSVALGTYTLDEDVSSTPSYAKDPNYPQSVTVGLGSSAGVGQTLTYTAVNPRQHRIIVLVCHEGTNSLFANTISFGGTDKTSLGAVPTALANKGVTQADLCSLGGAEFDHLDHTAAGSPDDVQVNIASH